MPVFPYHRAAHRNRSTTGFTLIELAIVLGIVGVLAAGLWRLMATGSQQTKDQAAAQQQQSLINAVEGFLADPNKTLAPYGGQYWFINSFAGPGTYNTLPLPSTNKSLSDCQTNGGLGSLSDFCNFLPAGFTSATTNAYGQKYIISVREESVVTTNGVPTTTPQTYSFMIQATGASIPDADGGRIASLIGGDGGFIYAAAVCTAMPDPTWACGTLGAWKLQVNPTYGLTGVAGNIASRTYIPATVNGGSNWLARITIPSDTTFSYNTMSTPQFMNAGADLYMYPDDNSTLPPTPITATGTNSIHLYNGALIINGNNVGGSIQLNSGTISLGGSSFIDGGGTTTAAEMTLIAPGGTPPLSGGVYGGNGLVYLSTAGCTQQNLSNSLAIGCPYTGTAPNQTILPAINVFSGDINLANGQMEALKILSASDARLKTNIRPIDDPLANLMKIDAVAFAYKRGGNESMGVTAQNLEKTYPQLVSESNGTKYVDYNGLIGPLIGAVQELKRQNDDLRDQLHQEQTRDDRLENLVTKKAATP